MGVSTHIHRGKLDCRRVKGRVIGDANNRHDPFSVPARNVVGKICLHAPYVGYVTEFLKTPWGFLLGLVIPALIVIAMYVRSIWQVLSQKKIDEVANG